MGFFSWISKKLSGSCYEECHSYYKKPSNHLRGKKKVAKLFAEECLVIGDGQEITKKELSKLWKEWSSRPKNRQRYRTFDPDKTRGLMQGLNSNHPGIIIGLYNDYDRSAVYKGIGKKKDIA
jgi:hypothetical protein